MATASNDEWTEAKCIQLIREYRKRQCLWDPKNTFFFKKPMKLNCWEEIGKILDVHPDDCKHKMNILTSSFRREKAKIMHSLLDGKESGEIYQSTWFGFKEMAFLMDRDTERRRQFLGIEDDGDNNKPNIKRNLLTLHPEPTASNSPRTKKLKASVGVRKQWAKEIAQKVQMGDNKTQPQAQSQPQPQPSAGPSQRICNDEIASFATFIANKMKKYTEKTKNAVQQAICEIIFKADQEYFGNDRCEKFTIIDEQNDPLDRFSNDTIKIENDSDISD